MFYPKEEFDLRNPAIYETVAGGGLKPNRGQWVINPRGKTVRFIGVHTTQRGKVIKTSEFHTATQLDVPPGVVLLRNNRKFHNACWWHDAKDRSTVSVKHILNKPDNLTFVDAFVEVVRTKLGK